MVVARGGVEERGREEEGEEEEDGRTSSSFVPRVIGMRWAALRFVRDCFNELISWIFLFMRAVKVGREG